MSEKQNKYNTESKKGKKVNDLYAEIQDAEEAINKRITETSFGLFESMQQEKDKFHINAFLPMIFTAIVNFEIGQLNLSKALREYTKALQDKEEQLQKRQKWLAIGGILLAIALYSLLRWLENGIKH